MTPDRIVDVVLALDPMAELPRTGWILRGIQPAESIAAHSHAVAIVAMLLVDALRAAGVVVDGERVLRMALLHDAPEARTGDIPLPNKTPAMVAALAELEHTIAESLLPPPLVALWVESDRGKSMEARLARAADKLQLMIKVHAYERRGHTGLDGFWTNPANFYDGGLPFVRDVYQALADRAGRTLPDPPQ